MFRSAFFGLNFKQSLATICCLSTFVIHLSVRWGSSFGGARMVWCGVVYSVLDKSYWC
jgi:hypothetical protein